MDYYTNKLKAMAEVEQWIEANKTNVDDDSLKAGLRKLKLSIVLNYGFSEKFVEKYFKLRGIKLSKEILYEI